MEHTYIAIDLKSFYASVECVERKENPLTTNLVVADESRTEKTICLAVSPSLKAFGIPGRARLFEVVAAVKEVNRRRLAAIPERRFSGKSCHAEDIDNDKSLAVSYIVAPPRMAKYMEYSTRIYQIYLRYFAPEDMHVYSVDEVFMDATRYLSTYKMSARELTRKIIQDILSETGITATAGIGTNLYLCKIAMDVWAKHTEADKDGVRIAELDEMSYRRYLWDHKPITDFWRVGRGYAKKLAENGMFTMGDIARCSVGKPGEFYNEGLLYDLFGVNAELLIDHAWGWEPCTIEDIKAYKPSANSISTGQVLSEPYDFEKTRLIIREMTELLVLDLLDKHLVTDRMVLTVGYDIENLTDKSRRNAYNGEVVMDRYGRKIPKHAHGTANLKEKTSSISIIMDAVMELYDRIMDPALLTRRMSVVAANVVDESEVEAQKKETYEQLSLFTDIEAEEERKKEEKAALLKERKAQEAVLAIRKKFGKNAILKGTNLEEGATTIDRNRQIGGHKA
ncbi:MAG: DNA methylase [Clostridium sp.]|nr:DNA methylase [Clostridium sp.]